MDSKYLHDKSKDNIAMAQYCLENDLWFSGGVSRAYYGIFQKIKAILIQNDIDTGDYDKSGGGSHNYIKEEFLSFIRDKNTISHKDKGDIMNYILSMKRLRIKADYHNKAIEKNELETSLVYADRILQVITKL